MSEDVPKSKLMAGPDDYRAIDYPVFCNPAETPVTVERIRLMYSDRKKRRVGKECRL